MKIQTESKVVIDLKLFAIFIFKLTFWKFVWF